MDFRRNERLLINRIDRRRRKAMKATAKMTCSKCGHAIRVGQDAVHRAYGDYHEVCYLSLCRKGSRIAGLALAFLVLLFPFAAFAAEELPPALSCGKAQDARHALCEMRHYFGAWHPLWEVYADGKLVADERALVFRPVIGEDWRTISVSIPAKDGKLVFEVEARSNQGRVEFRATNRQASYVPHGERIAAKSP